MTRMTQPSTPDDTCDPGCARRFGSRTPLRRHPHAGSAAAKTGLRLARGKVDVMASICMMQRKKVVGHAGERVCELHDRTLVRGAYPQLCRCRS